MDTIITEPSTVLISDIGYTAYINRITERHCGRVVRALVTVAEGPWFKTQLVLEIFQKYAMGQPLPLLTPYSCFSNGQQSQSANTVSRYQYTQGSILTGQRGMTPQSGNQPIRRHKHSGTSPPGSLKRFSDHKICCSCITSDDRVTNKFI